MAPSSLDQDPTYLALRRAMGFDEGSTQANADLETTRAQTMLDLARPELAFQGAQQRRQINLGAEDRGMWGSGERLRDLAVQRRNQGAQLGQLEIQGANSIADIQRQMAQQIAAGRRSYADQTLSAAGDAYLRGGLDPWDDPF